MLYVEKNNKEIIMSNGKLCPVAFGMSVGVLWGLSNLVMGLLLHFYMYGKVFVETMGQLYVGYAPSVVGSLLGGLFGFIHAFIAGFLVIWLYNVFSGYRCKK